MSVEQITRFIIDRDQRIIQLRRRALSGDAGLLNNQIQSIYNLLHNGAWHAETYQQINQLVLSAKPHVVQELNNKIFPKVQEVHSKQELDQYIIFWKRLLPGNGSKIQYPTVSRTLAGIKIRNENRQLPKIFNKYNNQFENNMANYQQKKVQFFEDFNDSFVTESMDDERVSEIIQMDILEIDQIRQIVEAGSIDELTSEEYLRKMQNFLSLKPRTMSKELSHQFNRQRLWAKEYIDHHQEYSNGVSCYLHKYFNSNPDQPSRNTNQSAYQRRKTQSSGIENDQPKLQINNISGQQIQIKQEICYGSENAPMKKKRNFINMTNLEDKKFTYVDRQVPMLTKDLAKQNSESNIGLKNHQIKTYTESNKEEINYRRTAPQHQKMQEFSDQSQGKNKNRNTMQEQYNQNQGQRVVRDSSRIFKNNLQKNSDPEEEDLYNIGIIKYGKRQEEPQFLIPKHNSSENDGRAPSRNSNQIIMKTPENMKMFNNDSQFTPGTAFPNRGGFSSSKKLSDFKREKQQRKMCAPLDHLTPIEGYVLKPYSQHFNQINDFTRFRRNCLEDSFILYASQFLLVSCEVKQQNNSKICLEISYINQSGYPLVVQTIYRIPKCFKIQKKSNIKKRFLLTEKMLHAYTLQMMIFPLQSCLLNLKYKIEEDPQHLSHQYPTVIPLPLTIRNFLQFLMVTEEEWKRSWVKLSSEPRNFKISRHIILDKNILSDNELEAGLKQFRHFSSVQGYSADEFGALCRHLSYHKMVFLLRISLRVDNILTLQIVTDRAIAEQDEIQFLEYCLSVWGMLLCKIEDSSIL